MILPLGMLDRRLDIVDGDQRTTGIEGRGAEATRRRGGAIALMGEAEAQEAVDLVAQRSAPFPMPADQLSCDVWVEDNRGTHAYKHNNVYADVRIAS